MFEAEQSANLYQARGEILATALSQVKTLGRTLLKEAKDVHLKQIARSINLCIDVVDASLLVSEERIEYWMRWMWVEHQMMIEGAAAVALSGLETYRERINGKRVGVVICGGNVGDALRTRICST